MLGQIAIRKGIPEGHCDNQESSYQLRWTGQWDFRPAASRPDAEAQDETENGFNHGCAFAVAGAGVPSGFLGKA